MAAPLEDILKLIGDYSGYHPSKVYREKRNQQALAELKLQQQESEPSATCTSDRPEGEAGEIWDAENFIAAVSKIQQEKLVPSVEKLNQLYRDALDVKKDDTSRKLTAREFVKACTQWDEICSKTEINDIKLFTGVTKDKPLQFTFGEDAQSTMRLSFDSLMAKDIGLDKVRLDTLMDARRSVKVMDQITEKIELIEDILGSKRSFLKLRKQAIKEQEEEDKKNNKSGFISSSDMMQRKQIKAAKAKGRTSALLLNIKV